MVAVTDLSNKRIVSFPKKGSQTEPSSSKKPFRGGSSAQKSKRAAAPVEVVEPELESDAPAPVPSLVPTPRKPRRVKSGLTPDQLSLDTLMANATAETSAPASAPEETGESNIDQLQRVA